MGGLHFDMGNYFQKVVVTHFWDLCVFATMCGICCSAVTRPKRAAREQQQQVLSTTWLCPSVASASAQHHRFKVRSAVTIEGLGFVRDISSRLLAFSLASCWSRR